MNQATWNSYSKSQKIDFITSHLKFNGQDCISFSPDDFRITDILYEVWGQAQINVNFILNNHQINDHLILNYLAYFQENYLFNNMYDNNFCLQYSHEIIKLYFTNFLDMLEEIKHPLQILKLIIIDWDSFSINIDNDNIYYFIREYILFFRNIDIATKYKDNDIKKLPELKLNYSNNTINEFLININKILENIFKINNTDIRTKIDSYLFNNKINRFKSLTIREMFSDISKNSKYIDYYNTFKYYMESPEIMYNTHRFYFIILYYFAVIFFFDSPSNVKVSNYDAIVSELDTKFSDNDFRNAAIVPIFSLNSIYFIKIPGFAAFLTDTHDIYNKCKKILYDFVLNNKKDKFPTIKILN